MNLQARYVEKIIVCSVDRGAEWGKIKHANKATPSYYVGRLFLPYVQKLSAVWDC